MRGSRRGGRGGSTACPVGRPIWTAGLQPDLRARDQGYFGGGTGGPGTLVGEAVLWLGTQALFCGSFLREVYWVGRLEGHSRVSQEVSLAPGAGGC